MMKFLFKILILTFWSLSAVSLCIKIDLKHSVGNFKHFWKSTGFCPPDPKSNIYQFLLSDEEKVNLALIGALPHKGIEQVRIHWLFNLIFINNENNIATFNFTYLDELLKFLIIHNLKPRFELMGLPNEIKGNFVLDKLRNRENTQKFWANLVEETTKSFGSEITNNVISWNMLMSFFNLEMFGEREVSSWTFELWNEPDLKTYNLLNFTLPEYLEYANGCAEGLRNAFIGKSMRVTLGGPAGLFREENHPLCWGLLEACDSLEKSHCPIQFISFHRKGDGTAEGVLNGSLELLDLLHNKFPNLIQMPIANDESDMIKTWSDSWEWRGDARYAAMVVKVIGGLYKSVTLDRKLKIELLSNDNGFLNYHPFYFTQRTLFARFQMNHTDPPHNQFIKKPVYSVMALLSLLGDEFLKQKIRNNDHLLTVLCTRTQSTYAILLAYADNHQVNIETVRTVKLTINNLSIEGRFVVYLIDNIETNPYFLWEKLGKPVFPSKRQRQILRNHEEPHRLFEPANISRANLNISLNLTIPSVALIHICSKPSTSPGPVSKLSIFNVTGNEILLTWSDYKIDTKCTRTYEVEFESKCENSLQFQRINANDTIFLSYHHAPTGDGACETTIGRYRVRAVDYWDQPGNYSKIVSNP